MLRLAVTAYLTFVAFIGPGLCCCTAMRFADGMQCRQGRQHEHKGHACCHHEPVNDGQRPLENDQQPHCPINDHRLTPVALVPGDGHLADLFKTGQFVAFAAPMAVLDVGRSSDGTSLSAPAPGDDGALFGRDILRALHMLRC
jgi:hypothetical protein